MRPSDKVTARSALSGDDGCGSQDRDVRRVSAVKGVKICVSSRTGKWLDCCSYVMSRNNMIRPVLVHTAKVFWYRGEVEKRKSRTAPKGRASCVLWDAVDVRS